MKTWDISNFNLNTTLTNYTMVDGLTPEKIKYKYIWLLNALVENAIVGEDEYGLVWYAGTWYGGEWEDGTWYSGIWHDGEWKNGKFYSYRFDLQQLLIRNRRILEKDNPVYSQFLHGIWRRGEFYNGYFGPEGFYDNWDSKSKIERFFHETRWEGGVFYNGIFRNSAWWKGKFQGGIFYNSEWFNQLSGSTFSNGTFQGNTWWDGSFTGGDFVLGDWLDGNFNQANPNIRSRFGSMPITGATTKADVSVVWHTGNFINGEFHSGLNLISGFTNVSDNHNRTHWLDGTWYNGTWYGGTHSGGTFNNGYWFEGYWSGGTFNNGYWVNGFWEDGIINDGFFIQGLFKHATVYGGQLGYQSEYLKTRSDTSITFPTKFLGALSTVITDTGVTNITQTTATSGGEVLYDGGEIVTRRGVCWSDSEYPNITTNYRGFTSDGNGVGGFVSYLTGLNNNTEYYVRAYAINALGTSYGHQVPFTAHTPPPTTTTTTTLCYTYLGKCYGGSQIYETTQFSFNQFSNNQRFFSGSTYYFFGGTGLTSLGTSVIVTPTLLFGCPTTTTTTSLAPPTTTTTSSAPTTTTTSSAPTTTTTSSAPTTTTTTTPAFKIWNFSLLLYTSYLCWNTTDFTGSNSIYTAYSANPLTITEFFNDTALSTPYAPGNLDTIGYVEAPSTIIVYTATITGIGDVSGNALCPPTTTTTTT